MLLQCKIYHKYSFEAENEKEAYKYEIEENDLDDSYNNEILEDVSEIITKFCKKYKDNIKIGNKDNLEAIDENNYIDIMNYYESTDISSYHEQVNVTDTYCIYMELNNVSKDIIETKLDIELTKLNDEISYVISEV